MIETIVNFINNIKDFGPTIRAFLAILTILLGWLISEGVRRITVMLLNKFKFNLATQHIGWKQKMDKAEVPLDGSAFFGKVAQWVFIILFIFVAFYVANVPEISNLLFRLVTYLPNIIISSLIFIAAVFASNFSYRIIIGATGGKVSYSTLIGSIIRGAIWTFATLAILLQLGIAPDIVRIIAIGIVAMAALGGGLAIGLGSKDLVNDFLKETKDRYDRGE
jgi:hypothetical protein